MVKWNDNSKPEGPASPPLALDALVPSTDIDAMLCGTPRDIAYSFHDRYGRLWMDADTCCDMRGCIQFFMSIDPTVERIDTFSGELRDTRYVRTHDGWEARREYH